MATTSGHTDQVTDRLIASEIRADANNVYFDVAHKTVQPAKEHDGASAQLYLGRDGCKVTTPPRLHGTVWRDWQDPSTLTASLAELPDGELQVVLAAFGQEQSWLLRKSGKDLRPMKLEDSFRYRAIPADPEAGLPAAAGLALADCSRRAP